MTIIGEGTRGRVFLAEWTTPGGGLAALKCARPGTGTAAVDSRLVALDHPSLATLYEVGTTDALGAYAISEYVPGLPITRYCDRRQPSSAERLELWLQAADGIAYAHSRGVPHLNLKPTNVLVVEGMVKVLDFERAMPASVETAPGPYLAPEQTNPHAAGARSDIFALGVLLGELMTGRPDAGLVEEVAQRATRLDPRERQQSAVALAASVRGWLHVL